MEARHFFLLISAIALFAAVFSPIRLPVFLLLPAIVPEIFWQSLGIRIFVNTLVIAVAIVALSGVPAALFERVCRRPQGDDVTMVVWASAAALLALSTWQIG